jgi:hypothetical protein
MTKSLLGSIASAIAVLALLGRASALAGDGPDNPVLKKHGLKVVGALAVLESESQVKNKLSDVRRLSRQLSNSLMRQQGTMTAEDHQNFIKGLGAEINQMKAQVNALSQQMSRIPRGRRGFANNFVAEQFAELKMYRDQLQAEVNQESAWLNQLRSQKYDPKSKEKVDAEVRDRREAYHQALLDLRTVVDAATEKYAALAKDEDVKKALDAASKAAGTRIKLGPSHDFSSNVKLLEKFEKAESSAEPDGSAARPTRRSKVGTKSKRSLKSGSGTGAADDPDSGSRS